MGKMMMFLVLIVGLAAGQEVCEDTNENCHYWEYLCSNDPPNEYQDILDKECAGTCKRCEDDGGDEKQCVESPLGCNPGRTCCDGECKDGDSCDDNPMPDPEPMPTDGGKVCE